MNREERKSFVELLSALLSRSTGKRAFGDVRSYGWGMTTTPSMHCNPRMCLLRGGGERCMPGVVVQRLFAVRCESCPTTWIARGGGDMQDLFTWFRAYLLGVEFVYPAYGFFTCFRPH